MGIVLRAEFDGKACARVRKQCMSFMASVEAGPASHALQRIAGGQGSGRHRSEAVRAAWMRTTNGVSNIARRRNTYSLKIVDSAGAVLNKLKVEEGKSIAVRASLP